MGFGAPVHDAELRPRRREARLESIRPCGRRARAHRARERTREIRRTTRDELRARSPKPRRVALRRPRLPSPRTRTESSPEDRRRTGSISAARPYVTSVHLRAPASPRPRMLRVPDPRTAEHRAAPYRAASHLTRSEASRRALLEARDS